MHSGMPCYETRHAGGDTLETHRHQNAYLALVTDGEHVEASVDGPVRCEAGTVLLHPRFHAHGNRFKHHGARVLNLALPDALAPDRLIVLHTSDVRDACALLRHGNLAALRTWLAACLTVSTTSAGWQTAFVAALGDEDEPVAGIACKMGVSTAHASRSLLRSHGMGPQALRRELRWRRALSLLAGDASLADVAAQAGFADQSHLHRTVRTCSGMTPAQLRRQIKSVQDQARLAAG